MRYRVFVSSTIDDLHGARVKVDEELSGTEIFEVVRVETLPATDKPSRRVCLDEVVRADAIVLIVSTRCGFIPAENNPEGLSVTHLEYREAKRLGKPVFAFVQEGVTPEPALTRLIQEVSHFDEGVLRKRWRSVDELQREARRALLFWLCREARGTHSRAEQERAAAHLGKFAEVGQLPVVLVPVDVSDNDLQAWEDNFLNHLKKQCKHHLLPLPRQASESEAESPRAVLTVEVRPGRSRARFAVRVSIRRTDPSDETDMVDLPSVELDPLRAPDGARLVADAALALVFVLGDDLGRGIGWLLTVSTHRGVTYWSRERFLEAAAFVSALNKGERSSAIVQRLLGLPSLERSTVNAGIMCLLAAQVRYEHAGARRALAETERLALRLLTEALARNQAATEFLYNLARQALRHFPAEAVAFYERLVNLEPSYDARWYFHRDLGLLDYHAGRFSSAGQHYDQACRLRSHDSELWRFAGDACYYHGDWAGALLRYEKALEIEPVDVCFLDSKIQFARDRICNRMPLERCFEVKRSISHWFSRLGGRAAKAGIGWLAHPLCLIATRICELNFDANNWLALFANRSGCYSGAVAYLKRALAVIPEDAAVRLNLVVNLIFAHHGKLADDAHTHARIAIFHGGPETGAQFRLRLANTPNRDTLCQQFQAIFADTEPAWKAWRARRLEVLKPERFGDVVHVEARH